jgi:hypothetical protein
LLILLKLFSPYLVRYHWNTQQKERRGLFRVVVMATTQVSGFVEESRSLLKRELDRGDREGETGGAALGEGDCACDDEAEDKPPLAC